MIRIATSSALFTYLSVAPASIDTVAGDGRINLAAEPPASLDVLVVDAFTGDAIPAHLLTKEALALYLEKLRPGGVILFHTTNSYVDVDRVVTGAAAMNGLAGTIRDDGKGTGDQPAGGSPSEWIVLARGQRDLGSLLMDPGWTTLDSIEPVTWTDDYSDIVRVLRWH